MTRRHYLNLTNGIEWRDELLAAFPGEPISYCRLTSTGIEKDDWSGLLLELDANLLMPLALGDECHFYDCGTRREMSKTVKVGIPFVVETLNLFWFGDPRLHEARTEQQRAAKRKLLYYRRWATGDVRLIGHSKRTEHDGDWNFYAKILSEEK